MDHLLTCSCGKAHSVSRSQAGQVIVCECGNQVNVPTLRDLAQLPTVPEAISPPTAISTWGGWRGPAMAIFTGAFLVAAGCATWFALQRATIDTSYNAESEIAAGTKLLKDYGPDELSTVWSDFEATGLGKKNRPVFYYWNRYAQERMNLATGASVLAIVFGALSASVWLSAKNKKAKLGKPQNT